VEGAAPPPAAPASLLAPPVLAITNPWGAKADKGGAAPAPAPAPAPTSFAGFALRVAAPPVPPSPTDGAYSSAPTPVAVLVAEASSFAPAGAAAPAAPAPAPALRREGLSFAAILGGGGAPAPPLLPAPAPAEEIPPPAEATSALNASGAGEGGGGSRRGAPAERAPLEPLTESRIAQRAKAIAKGKNSAGYAAYIAAVPPAARQMGNARHPVTPDRHAAVSTRAWAGRLAVWRKNLHAWDPAGEGAAACDMADCEGAPADADADAAGHPAQ
jgi:hypothetical protein